MAKLKRVLEVAEHGALSPALRELYTQRGDKYVLDADDAEVLQQALETERQKARALEATLANYGELTPETAKKLQEETARAQREKDLSAGNFQNILDQEREKHVKDLALRDKGEERLRASLEDALISSEAGRAIRDAGGSEALLLPIVKARTKLQTAGDREVAVVLGDKGGPRLKPNAKSADEFMSIPEYVAELKADKTYAGAFAATVGSGSGGGRAGQRPVPVGPAKAATETAQRLAKEIAGGATRVGE